MKMIDTLRLATRNLINNFSHSLLAIVSITILSTLIMTIANFCVVYSSNLNANVVESVNLYGAYISVTLPYGASTTIDKYDVENLVRLAKNNSIADYYSADFDARVATVTDKELEIKPYIGGLQGKDRYEIYNGLVWQADDDNKPNIWLSKSISDDLGLGIDEKILIKLPNKPNEIEYTIKGITDYYSYVDYRYFDLKSITIGANSSNYSSLSEINALKKSAEDFAKLRSDYNVTGNYVHSAMEMSGFVYGLCAALIAFSIGVSSVCLLNTLKINIEKNNATFGMMKALGAKNKNIQHYILTQMGLLILFSHVIATVISGLIGYFAIGKPIGILMRILFSELSIVTATPAFWFVLPLISLGLAGGVIFLSALPMLSRYVKQDAIQIINEGNV